MIIQISRMGLNLVTLTLTLKVKLALKLSKYLLFQKVVTLTLTYKLKTCKIFKLSNGPLWNFTFTVEVFIDHIKVSDEFETSDLDIQGQICHES